MREQVAELRSVINDLEKDVKYFEKLVKERTIELESANERLQKEIIERKQVEEALLESEERYRRLVELSPDAITVSYLRR